MQSDMLPEIIQPDLMPADPLQPYKDAADRAYRLRRDYNNEFAVLVPPRLMAPLYSWAVNEYVLLTPDPKRLARVHDMTTFNYIIYNNVKFIEAPWCKEITVFPKLKS